MSTVYHLLLVIDEANVVLKPLPFIPVVAEAHVTPAPLDSCEKDKPGIEGEIVAVGIAGQVMDPIPE
jgi:hypothetical protein